MFFTQVAPLADKCYQAATQLDKFQAPVYQTIARELWTLFPNFATSPIDPAESLLKVTFFHTVELNQKQTILSWDY